MEKSEVFLHESQKKSKTEETASATVNDEQLFTEMV